MERDQIVKALECCRDRGCQGCIRQYTGRPIEDDCRLDLIHDALALIRELTEEVNARKEQHERFVADVEKQLVELAEEKERLRVVADMSNTTLTDALRIVNEFCDSRIKRDRVKTVTEMQDRLKEKLYTIPTVYNSHFGKMLDQIAREMLEDQE